MDRVVENSRGEEAGGYQTLERRLSAKRIISINRSPGPASMRDYGDCHATRSNSGILSGLFRAFFGLANKDQVDTGKAIVAAANAAGQDIAFDTYSNGVNAAGKVAQGMSAGDLQSATVVGPNANSPAPVQAMDQADGDTTQIYISINDPALALAVFGSQSADDWTSEFGDRVHVTDQPSHNLNQYRGAQGKAPWPGFCSAEFASCN